MKKVSKRTFFLVIALVLVLGLGAYIGIQHLEYVEEQRREEEELSMKLEELERMLAYGERMFFDHNFYDRSALSPFINIRNRMHGMQTVEFNEVVFVHSEEEAGGFGEDVVVLWPTEKSETLLEFINDWIDRNPDVFGTLQPQEYVEAETIDLASLDVELPLTIDFMVDRWETMNEIFSRLNEISIDGRRPVGEALRSRTRNRLREREREAQETSGETDEPDEETTED